MQLKGIPGLVGVVVGIVVDTVDDGVVGVVDILVVEGSSVEVASVV